MKSSPASARSALRPLAWCSRFCLAVGALLLAGLPLRAQDEGREMIRDIIKEEDLTYAVILNASNKEMRDLLRKDLLARSPDSAQSVDGFLSDMSVFVAAEVIQDGHKVMIEASAGNINPRTRSLLLAQGLPKSFIKPTAAVLSIKIDGKDIKGEALDAFGEAFAQEDRKPDTSVVLNAEQEKMVNAIFDKDLTAAIVLGRKNPEWQKGLAKITAEHPGLQIRLDSVNKNITHVVGIALEKSGMKVGVVVALGDFNAKVRDTFVAGGVPEALVGPQAAMLSVTINGVPLKGDKLQDFAEAFKKAAVTAEPSLIDLSK